MFKNWEIMVKSLVLSSLACCIVIRPSLRIIPWGMAYVLKTYWCNFLPKLVAWAWKQVELEIMFESGEIMVESIVLLLPHLLYCDPLPSQNLTMKLGIHIEDIMNQYSSKSGDMSMKKGLSEKIMFESEEIMVKAWYCSSLSCRIVIHPLLTIWLWNLA